MPRRTGVIILLAGLAVMVLALVDPTNLGETGPAAPGLGGMGELGTWTTTRIAVLAAGALVGLLGAYGVLKPGGKKKGD